jgi:hypothetical protein
MGMFDPAAVNRQIDAVVASVPSGKKVLVIADGQLTSKTLRAAIVIRISDNVGGYVRVSKSPGQKLDGDFGVSASFLLDGDRDEFDYDEVVELLRDRGFGLFKAHWKAFRLFDGHEVAL